MDNVKYLYGAAVQGIQGFIFQTNRLREIVGASELVHEICTDLFNEYAGQGEVVQRAAGAIKHIYTDKEACERTVLEFPKKVMEFAPGITLSQAVVRYVEGNSEATGEIKSSFADAVDALEKKLRVQRNRQQPSLTCGVMGIMRSRATGLPLLEMKKERPLDVATIKTNKKSYEAAQELCRWNFGDYQAQGLKLVFDTDKMTSLNDWIAVVHIDGNGLGQVVQKIGTNKEDFKCFSSSLEEVTKDAAKSAFDTLQEKFSFDGYIPMRPIVLSGDDHTLICRADLAIPYVKAYLAAFEKFSKEKLGKILSGVLPFECLTACAGIAYVKSSFPFHFAYKIAEELCGRAKMNAKSEKHKIDGLPRSCMMFHKIQDSFVNTYADIVERELTPSESLTFEFGPYYFKDNINERDKGRLSDCWTIDELEEMADFLGRHEDGNAIKSGLRKWMGLLYDGDDIAAIKLKRMKSLMKKDQDVLEKVKKMTDFVPVYPEENSDKSKSAVYDILVLFTIMNQRTKGGEK